MHILVWGLGYVGTVSAACLAKLGHEVVGVEINPVKVNAINNRSCSIKETGLQEIIHEMVYEGRLSATIESKGLVKETDVSLICVGTPSSADGSPQLNYIESVAQEIGIGLREANNYHVVVIRSTIFPGITRNLLCPILEKYSEKKAGDDFGLVMNPEFLREASAVYDFINPPYTIIGELDSRAGGIVHNIYQDIQSPIHHVRLEEAEFIKLVSNAFHAIKIGFANEIGRYCDRLQVDSHKVMNMVCEDRKLNISSAYLKPGFAFGGSCLPKDLRSLTFHARHLGIESPIIDSIIPSNNVQIQEARIKVQNLSARTVGILGLSFKPGTDDMRESPIIELIKGLWQDGMNVIVYDPEINQEEMLGSNKEYLERQLPQIQRILAISIDELKFTDVIIVAQNRPEFASFLYKMDGDSKIIDLVRIFPIDHPVGIEKYIGLSWQ